MRSLDTPSYFMHVLVVNHIDYHVEGKISAPRTTPLNLCRNDMLIIPATHESYWEWSSQQERKHSLLFFSSLFFHDVASEYDIDPDTISLTEALCVKDQYLSNLMGALSYEVDHDYCFGKTAVENITRLIALRLIQKYSTKYQNLKLNYSATNNFRLNYVLDYIHANLGHDLSLKELSKTADMNGYQLNKAFKESLGMTPHQYILEQRISKAQMLLKNKKLTLPEIYTQLGFCTLGHFKQCFYQRLGITPQAYRDLL